MKGTIDKNGTLYICAETPLESYALSQWISQNLKATQPHENTPEFIFDANKVVFIHPDFSPCDSGDCR